MARDQMDRVLNSGYPAPRLDLAHAVLEESLASPSPDDRHPVGLGQGFVGGHFPFDPAFPEVEVVRDNGLRRFGGKGEGFATSARLVGISVR